MKHSYLLLCLAISLTTQLFAQKSSLKGVIIDSQDQSLLTGANIILLNTEEQPVKASFSDKEGKFNFTEINTGEYILKISFIGYLTYQKNISITQPEINLGNINLLVDNNILEQIDVIGKTPPTVQKGDTTEYNSQAFKTNPDANAEDLIQKMPGITTQNGTVKAQGEQVRRVLVDGKAFFGDDANTALKNLPANVIDKIQVFDQASDQAQFTGVDDGESVKTINIVTKVEMRNGTFGRVYAGYGTDDAYKAGGNVNFFNQDKRISVIGQSNNINIQNFSSEDLVGVASASSGGGGRGRGGRGRGNNNNTGNFLVGQQSGISTSHAIGLNYTDKWGEKISASGSYFFNNTQNTSIQALNREYFLEGNQNQFYDEQNLNTAKNFNNRLTLDLEYNISQRTSIIMRPRLSFQSNNAFENFTGNTTETRELLNQSNSNSSSDLGGYNFSNNLTFRHRFEKRGRTLSWRIRTSLNQNSGNGSLLSENRYFNDTSEELDLIDQQSDILVDGLDLDSRLTYSEPLGKNGSLQFTYQANYQKNESDRSTFDFDEVEQDYINLNPNLSNIFKSNYYTQGLETQYRYTKNRNFFAVGAEYQWANLESIPIFPQGNDLNRNFQNVLPRFILSLRMKENKSLRLFYRTSTNPPSVNQLQEVINNSNPLQLSTGNAALNQSYQHRLVIRYSAPNVDKSQSFFVFFNSSYTSNYVANSTLIASENTDLGNGITLQRGAQLIRPINLQGAWSHQGLMTFGFPINFLKSNLNLDLGANYSRTPGLINEVSNFSNNIGVNTGIVLSSNISQNLDFTLSIQPAYNWVSNTIQTNLNNRYYSQSSRAKLNWIFGKGWVFSADVNNQFYKGLSEGFDQSFWLMGVGFGKKFLKDQKGELQLSVFDLLGQNNSIQRNITDVYLEDVRNNVLERYYMLTFSYRIASFKTSERDE